jgi:preprotein translocase SecE subunit
MAKYKPDQGTYARTTAFLLLAGLLLFGCHSMYYWLHSFRGADGGPGALSHELTDGPVPVLGMPVTGALLIATVVGIAGLVGLQRFLARTKIADLLIDAETEMRKCTWPSFGETVKSSVVILVVMLFFTGVLAGMDYMLNVVMSGYVFG